nr:transposase [Rhizobium sp. Leaf453]
MSPEYVRPNIKAEMNDDRDAEGIAEAASRPTMRFVDLRSEEQLDIQSLHRVRSRLVAQRTTLINQIRAILLECGLIFAAGRRKLEVALDVLPGDQEATLSPRMYQLIVELQNEWEVMDTKIAALNAFCGARHCAKALRESACSSVSLKMKNMTLSRPSRGGLSRHSQNSCASCTLRSNVLTMRSSNDTERVS